MKVYLLILIALCLGHSGELKAMNAEKDTIEVTKIWDKTRHDAFPDLFRFKDYFYCAFREGDNHVGNENNGKVRIVRSKEGKNWESVALFDMDEEDVREARLSVTPDGRLMAIVAAGVFKDGRYLTLMPFVTFSDAEGQHFSPLEKVTFGKDISPSLDWIWRLTWHKGTGYGIMYSVDYEMKEGKRIRTMYASLLSTQNGRHFEKVSQIDIDGSPNESTIRFDKNDKMYILIRRETEDQMGVLAESESPYKSWQFNRLNFRLGGPNFLFLEKDRLVIGSRFHEGNAASTALHVTDRKGKVLKTVKLPSGGDNSYPGMVIEKKKLWVAYYSSHEGKSSIYLAKVPLSLLNVN